MVYVVLVLVYAVIAAALYGIIYFAVLSALRRHDRDRQKSSR
jgi:sensor domain CHASE-containing protein